jgi:RNase P subunit RPR2
MRPKVSQRTNLKVTCKKCGAPFVIPIRDIMYYQSVRIPLPVTCPACRAKKKLSLRRDGNNQRRIEIRELEEE